MTVRIPDYERIDELTSADMVLIAMVFSLGLLGMDFKHMAVAHGYHFWDIPMTGYMVPFQVYTLAGTMVYSLSLAFSKISILFLYLRLSTYELNWRKQSANPMQTLSVLNIIIDVFELALPIPIVIPLQTSNLQKGLCLPYVCDWYIVGLAPSR
ncbi:hypothetical protein PMIN06_001482 [Paraphaeosphaeria minitans]